MSEPIFIFTVDRPFTQSATRLEAVLSSAEEALARAEAYLRRSQELRLSSVYEHLLSYTVLDRLPKETSRP